MNERTQAFGPLQKGDPHRMSSFTQDATDTFFYTDLRFNQSKQKEESITKHNNRKHSD